MPTLMTLTVQRKARLRQLPDGEFALRHPIVLLRGLGRTTGFWLDFPDFLCHGSDVIMMDLPGTGNNRHVPGTLSLPRLAAHVVATLKAESLLPCHLVGISLGGMVAIDVAGQLARTAPNAEATPSNLTSLTVMATSARCGRERRLAWEAAVPLARMLLSRRPTNRTIAPFLVAPDTLARRRDLVEVWDRIMEREVVRPIEVVRQILAAAAYGAERPLRLIRRPSLCLVSQDDALVSWRNTPRVWERLSTAEMQILRGCGHDLPTDDPEGVARRILAFAKRVECAEEPLSPRTS